MEWKASSCLSTFHRAWRKDWKGWRRADDDRAATGCLDQGARFATNRSKYLPRTVAREEWIQRRLKNAQKGGSVYTALLLAVKNRGKAKAYIQKPCAAK